MSDQHIASAFDRDLEALQAHLTRLSALVEAALTNAATALEAQDIPAAEKVIAGDKAIDDLEDFIQTEAATLIARRAPTAVDLRLVLAVMRVAHSLERVGDYAKNVAKRTRVLGPSAPVDGHAGTIRRMANLVTRMLDEALQALVRRDAALADAVRKRDLEIDQIYNTLFRSLFTYMMETRPISAPRCTCISSPRTSSAPATTPPTSPSRRITWRPGHCPRIPVPRKTQRLQRPAAHRPD
jgi:phosphate transport system protein